MLVDLTRDNPAADAVRRTIVFMRGLRGWPHPALVVSDDVRLARRGGEAAVVLHFASRPAVSSDGGPPAVDASVGSSRLQGFVLLPGGARLSVDEAPQAAGSAWRLRTCPAEGSRSVRFCQVFFAGGTGETREPVAGALLTEGAPAVDVAGRMLVLGREEDRTVEGITSGPLRGIAAVGFAPSVGVRLEVAGERPVEGETSEFGAAYLDADLPPETGFQLEFGAPT